MLLVQVSCNPLCSSGCEVVQLRAGHYVHLSTFSAGPTSRQSDPREQYTRHLQSTSHASRYGTNGQMSCRSDRTGISAVICTWISLGLTSRFPQQNCSKCDNWQKTSLGYCLRNHNQFPRVEEKSSSATEQRSVTPWYALHAAFSFLR